MSKRDPVLTRAFEQVGSSRSLARRLGISPQAISQWGRVPPLRVLDVEGSAEAGVDAPANTSAPATTQPGSRAFITSLSNNYVTPALRIAKGPE